MKLPTESNYTGTSINNIKMLIYGASKIGKSTFASHFDNAIFAATEYGLKELKVYKVQIQSWEEWLDFVKEIMKKNHKFKTIIIDIIDNLYKYCIDYICKNLHIDHPSDSKWSKGWDQLQREFERTIYQLDNAGFGLIFISQIDYINISVIKNIERLKTIPSMKKGCARIIQPLVDIIGCIYLKKINNEDKRIIRFMPTELIEAGSRLNKLPDEMILDYDKFKYLMNKNKIKKLEDKGNGN